jgi:hypothetical protein
LHENGTFKNKPFDAIAEGLVLTISANKETWLELFRGFIVHTVRQWPGVNAAASALPLLSPTNTAD